MVWVFWVRDKGWGFEIWALTFEVLEGLDCAEFAFPVKGVMADPGGPGCRVLEDEFVDAVRVAVARRLVGKRARYSMAKTTCFRENAIVRARHWVLLLRLC